jgi:hydroxymethylpyrimidine/phosphomethylpyrimidine kinase
VCIKHGAKRKSCSSEGCTNIVIKGGVCWRHGAKKKLCSSEGCTNIVVKGGVCKRHGACRNPNDESTAFASCFGSEFEKTTVTHPSQRNSDSSSNQGSLPVEIVLCGVIAENYEEV